MLQAILVIFFATYFKLFAAELRTRMESKSCANQINNQPLFIDFLNLKKILSLVKIELNDMYFYIEFNLGATFEKADKTYKVVCLKLFKGFKLNEYVKNPVIQKFLLSDKEDKKFFEPILKEMFVDNEKQKHEVALEDWKFFKTNLPKMKQSQFSTLKYVVDYFVDATLDYNKKDVVKTVEKAAAKK